MKYGKPPKIDGKNYQTRMWIADKNFPRKRQQQISWLRWGAFIVGSETISNLPKMVFNERIRR
jgi:hypothetical protein